jgi:hypothetical protein
METDWLGAFKAGPGTQRVGVCKKFHAKAPRRKEKRFKKTKIGSGCLRRRRASALFNRRPLRPGISHRNGRLCIYFHTVNAKKGVACQWEPKFQVLRRGGRGEDPEGSPGGAGNAPPA